MISITDCIKELSALACTARLILMDSSSTPCYCFLVLMRSAPRTFCETFLLSAMEHSSRPYAHNS